jgi:hypothetical protein
VTDAIFLSHFAATFFMAGLMSFVQVAHYPSFSSINPAKFKEYYRWYTRRAWVFAPPPMVLEAVTGVLLYKYRPDGVSFLQVTLGVALIAAIWLSTFLHQWPSHKKLAAGYDPQVHAFLLKTNWIRTIAYGLRALLVLWMAAGRP